MCSIDNVVIESDSMVIVGWLQIKVCSLRYLWNFWEDILQALEGLSFQISHVLREGNGAADFLANRALMVQRRLF